MVKTLNTRILKSTDELHDFYRFRYETFVVEQNAAPASLYTDGLLKDDFDNSAYHIGCFIDDELVGCISLVEKNDNCTLMVEKCHDVLLDGNHSYGEVMRLIIRKTSNTSTFGIKARIIGSLFGKIQELVVNKGLTHLFLQSTVSAQKMYERLGFKQIGEYKVYKGISNECPMLLEIEDINQTIFKEEV